LILRNFLRQFFYLIFFIFPLASCSSYEENSNKAFQNKYSKEVKKIRTERTAPKGIDKQVTAFSAPSTQEIAAQKAQDDPAYYAYVDVNKFGEKTPQNYMPNREVYEQTKNQGPSNSLPPDIFEITYNTNLYPAFRVSGAEFDSINIPPYDAHGVKTAMSDKTYLTAGGDALQRSIDTVSANRSRDDVEFSEILIAEQGEIKRKRKIERIFGKEDEKYLELAALKDDETEKPQVKKPSKAVGQDAATKAAAAISGFITRTIKN
jgi:hypothetical protein